jgi:hypothetical protein
VSDYIGQGTYEGPIVNVKAEGFGTWTDLQGQVYKGHFMNHMFHGQGTYTWATGDKFIGAFEVD